MVAGSVSTPLKSATMALGVLAWSVSRLTQMLSLPPTWIIGAGLLRSERNMQVDGKDRSRDSQRATRHGFVCAYGFHCISDCVAHQDQEL